jgi:protein-disulfide isomerase
LRHNRSVRLPKVLPLFLLAVLCLAQGNWQAVTDLPGVDWKGVTPAHKQAALKLMREDACACGCNMKIAECRVNDPSCAVSRKLANAAVKDFSDGKNVAAVRADLKKIADEPPPILDEAVSISTAGDPYKGPDNARITMVEFSDFQCPFCSKAVAEANAVLKQFPKDVRLVFKQFPLDSHNDAEFGAEAALAAQAQGKFWEMHDRLYRGFPDLSRKTVMGYAQQIGLDMKRFTSEVDSHKYQVRVRAEEQEGEKAGVGGTPTFFLNGKKYNGVFEASALAPVIRGELK